MRAHKAKVAGALVLVGALVVAVPAWASAPAAPSTVVAAWSFDQVAAGGRVIDLSPSGATLTLAGSWVAVPGRAGTAAVRFGTQSFGSAAVPSPGTADVAVTAVFRDLNPKPFHDTPNITQLGLYTDPAQVKLQISKAASGVAQCRFRGTTGEALVTGPAVNVTDGAWHKVTCWRQGSTLGVTVDSATASVVATVGAIQVDRPATVGARGLGAGDLSDQFLGDVDAVVWAVGTGARTASADYANAVVHQG